MPDYVTGGACEMASAFNSAAINRNPTMATTNNVVSRTKLLCVQTKTSWNDTAVQCYNSYLVKSFLYKNLANSFSWVILDCGSLFFCSLRVDDGLAFAFLSVFTKFPPRAISITAHLLGYYIS